MEWAASAQVRAGGPKKAQHAYCHCCQQQQVYVLPACLFHAPLVLLPVFRHHSNRVWCSKRYMFISGQVCSIPLLIHVGVSCLALLLSPAWLPYT